MTASTIDCGLNEGSKIMYYYYKIMYCNAVHSRYIIYEKPSSSKNNLRGAMAPLYAYVF